MLKSGAIRIAGDTNTSMNKELFNMIAKAKDEKLLPSNVNITEIEWSVDRNGVASVIEYWKTSLRVDSERVEVIIPESLRSGYFFIEAARVIQKRR